jgi:hypothetical protein
MPKTGKFHNLEVLNAVLDSRHIDLVNDPRPHPEP